MMDTKGVINLINIIPFTPPYQIQLTALRVIKYYQCVRTQWAGFDLKKIIDQFVPFNDLVITSIGAVVPVPSNFCPSNFLTINFKVIVT